MNDRRMELRIGLFTIVGLLTLVIVILMFGNLPRFFESTYPLYVHFKDAPGMQEGTPVRKSGLKIGEVTQVEFDKERGGVLVRLSILERYKLHEGATPHIQVSFLGDVNVDIHPGDQAKPEIEPGARLEGTLPIQIPDAVAQFHKVGKGLAELLGPEGKNAAELTKKLTDQWMATVDEIKGAVADVRKIIGDEKNQQNLAETLAGMRRVADGVEKNLPQMIANINKVAGEVDATLKTLGKTFATLERTAGDMNTEGKRTLVKLAGAFDKASDLFGSLDTIVRELQESRGSFHKFMNDPGLYDRLFDSADTLQVLLEELALVADNLKGFSEKIKNSPAWLMRGIFASPPAEEARPGAKGERKPDKP